VSAYVSKGAQDAWEKVLDGTYTGFSIGGKMNKWDDGYDEKMDTQIRIIKDYDLVELSLVDNPANQFASIISVEKVDGVDTLRGSAIDTVVENVFWDKESGLVMVSENEVEVSPSSGAAMQNIGFVEKTDSEKINMIKFLVDSAKGINNTKINKEDNMTDETTNVEEVEVAPEADDATVEEVVEDVAEVVEAEVAKAAENTVPAKPGSEDEESADEDQEDAEEDMKPVSKSAEEIANAVTDMKNTLTSAFSDMATMVKSLSDEVAELKKSLGFTSAQLADAESDFNNLGKRVDAVEADTAFRKSGDLGEIVQEPAMVEKSVWGGRFLNNADLLK